MGDERNSGYGSGGWDEGTPHKALLQQLEQNEESGHPVGDGVDADPSEVGDLQEALDRVNSIWRKRTQGQRLSARRWIEQEEHGLKAQWRCDLAEMLESTWTHIFIVSLLVVDLAATAVDILKTIHGKSHDLDVCVDMVEKCTTCIGHFDRSPEWKWTYWTSIVILAILMLNVVCLIVANGLLFFLSPLYVLDLIVVTTALGLEIMLDADTAGLIIILTLWRIVRVAHGIFEVTDEAWEKNIHQLEAKVREVQDAHDRDQALLQEKDQRISELESRVGGSNEFSSSRYDD